MRMIQIGYRLYVLPIVQQVVSRPNNLGKVKTSRSYAFYRYKLVARLPGTE